MQKKSSKTSGGGERQEKFDSESNFSNAISTGIAFIRTERPRKEPDGRRSRRAVLAPLPLLELLVHKVLGYKQGILFCFCPPELKELELLAVGAAGANYRYRSEGQT